jgi:hypothetical protein
MEHVVKRRKELPFGQAIFYMTINGTVNFLVHAHDAA